MLVTKCKKKFSEPAIKFVAWSFEIQFWNWWIIIIHNELVYSRTQLGMILSLVPEDEKIGRNRCWVEFDDGDSGEFPLPDVRMIPPDFPQENTGMIQSLFLKNLVWCVFFTRLSLWLFLLSLVSSSLDCESNSGLPEPARPKKSEQRTGDEGLDDDLASDSGDSAVDGGHDRTREKRRRDKKDYSTKARRTDDEYERSKTTKYRTFSEDSKTSRSERSNSKKKVKSDVGKDYTREDGDTRDDEGDMEWSGDVFSEEGSLRRKRYTVREDLFHNMYYIAPPDIIS